MRKMVCEKDISLFLCGQIVPMLRWLQQSRAQRMGVLWHQLTALEVSLLVKEDEREKMETTGPVA
jgi:hypothetical protein